MIIDVVIPTVTGREESLVRCMDAYWQRSANEIRITVVKNYPTCGAGWNAGAAKIEKPGDLLQFSADDLEPLEGWDVAAVAALAAQQQPSPKLLNPGGTVAYYGLQPFEPPDGTPVNFSTIPIFPWSLWAQVGPSLDCHYYTDNWLSLKAERLGLKPAYYSGYAFVHHHEMVARGAGMEENQRMVHDRAIFEQAVRELGEAA